MWLWQRSRRQVLLLGCASAPPVIDYAQIETLRPLFTTKADVVAYLDGGRIVEKGSPDDLLGRSGRFKKLYEMQMAEQGRGDSSATNVDSERGLRGNLPSL